MQHGLFQLLPIGFQETVTFPIVNLNKYAINEVNRILFPFMTLSRLFYNRINSMDSENISSVHFVKSYRWFKIF